MGPYRENATSYEYIPWENREILAEGIANGQRFAVFREEWGIAGYVEQRGATPPWEYVTSETTLFLLVAVGELQARVESLEELRGMIQ